MLNSYTDDQAILDQKLFNDSYESHLTKFTIDPTIQDRS